MDEQALIDRCLKGNAKAQRRLFEKYAPKMMAICMRYMHNEQEAKDVLQEGFIKVYQNLTTYQMNGSFEGWIRRIVVNTALDHLRKNIRHNHTVDIWDVEYKIEAKNTTLEAIQADELMQLIYRLPDKYRTVFNLHAIEGYSHKEIADLLNTKENTVKSQYARAKEWLRTKLEPVVE